VIKQVVNDNGGTAVPAAWMMTITNNGTALTPFAGSATGVSTTLAAGSFSVTESGGPAGYTGTPSADCSGQIAAGEQKTCTLTNDDQPAHLTVIKTVINDNGGTKSAADFTLHLIASGGGSASFTGAEDPGTTLTLNAGNYEVQEDQISGYLASFSPDCSGIIGSGQTKSCTVTNDDQAITVSVATTLSGGGQSGPSIRVAPGVTAIDQATLSGVTSSAGGTITYKVFADSACATLVFDATPSPNTVVNGVAPASIAFSSSTVGIFYWQAVYSGDNDNDGASSVCADERLRVAPSDAPVILVKKHVINDSGGLDATKVASNFMYQILNANGGGITQSFPGSETGRLFEFAPGTFYNVVEISNPAPTYTVSYSAACTATLQVGDVRICTITNDDIPPARLTVIKHVINDSGGRDATAVAANFSLQILNANGGGITQSFPGSETGTPFDLPRGGVYRVVELGTTPVYAVAYVASFSLDCAGTIQAGDVKTCTITNDDIPPARLTVIKHVVNDNGGTKVAANFSLQILNANGGGITQSFPGSETGTPFELPRGGVYRVVETTNPAPTYAASFSLDCSGQIAAGEQKTCTITNDDQPAHLTVIKTVINDNGGTKSSSDFTITVTNKGASLPPFPGSAAGTDVTLSAGTFSVDEAAVTGYTKSAAVGCSGTLALAETRTCTITNDDNAPTTATLTVIKHVVNDNGGAAIAGAWTMNVTGNSPSSSSFPGTEDGTNITVGAGAYSVDETGGPAGYAKIRSIDCSGTIAAGDARTCTITNNDVAAHLSVIKHLVNDNGGIKVAADFTISVTGGAVSVPSFPGAEAPGTTVTLNAGPYSVTETAVVGYAKSLGTDCSGIIALAESRSCTITNNDIAPQLAVIKHIVNDNGGTKIASDFTMAVTGTAVSLPSFPGAESPGTLVTLNAGPYGVDEGAVVGYSKTRSVGCSGSLAIGDTQTCTITNNDIGAELTVIKHVVNDNGGTKMAADFSITVTNNALTLPSFAGQEVPGTVLTLSAGSFSVAEASVAGYQATLSAGCSGTLLLADTRTCTITNDDTVTQPPPQLTVIKHVANDNGGTKAAADFMITITNNGTPLTSFAGSEAGTTRSLAAGGYSVAETSVAGYAATLVGDCNGTLALGDTKTCTITNDDVGPQLTVIKHVVNDNGGTRHASDFFITVTNNGASVAVVAGAEAPGTIVTINAGAYSVDEDPVAGYAKTLSQSCSGTLAVGQSATCTVNNNDLPPAQLIVKKVVVNDNGGTAVPADWTITVIGNSPTPASFAGSTAGTTVTIGAGFYQVGESGGPVGYVLTASAECSGTIETGQTITCTLTNDDVAPQLYVTKHVINDNGGTNFPADFTMIVTGNSPNPASFPGTEPGRLVTLNAGSYTVDELAAAGYTKTLSAGCSGTLAIGGVALCTVTNDDIGGDAQITVVKHVVNDNGGTKIASDFTMTVSGRSPSPASFPGSETGTVVSLNSGDYGIDETPIAGYQKTLGPDCFGTIAPGEARTCTITNDDIAPGTTFTANSFLDGADDVIDGRCFSTAGQGCTLRAAVQEANAHFGPDTVVMGAGTYTLTIMGAGEGDAATGDLNIFEDLTIVGAGSSSTIVKAASGWDDRLFSAQAKFPSNSVLQNLTLRGFTVTGGNADMDGGGAIRIYGLAGQLLMSDVRAEGNRSAGSGGGVAIFFTEVLTGTDLAFVSNTAGSTLLGGTGGGLWASARHAHLDRISAIGNTIIGAGGGIGLTASAGSSLDHFVATDNQATGDSGGAQVLGAIAVRHATILRNRAAEGGGIFLRFATLTDATIDSNVGDVQGGGVLTQNSGGLERVVISNNTVGYYGGGLYDGGGTGIHLTDVSVQGNAGGGLYLNSFGDAARMTNVTVANNRGAVGILDADSTGMILTNVTISGNTAGGVYRCCSASPMQMINVTVAFNSGFAGITLDAGLLARNVIVAENAAGNWDCRSAVPTSLGHNLDSGGPVDVPGLGSCGFGGGPMDQINTDPKLDPLANYGGLTPTHALQAGSPAIDMGDSTPGNCPATDQRGVSRPQDGDGTPPALCDIGAFERRSPTTP
jgi:hypothetical protein